MTGIQVLQCKKIADRLMHVLISDITELTELYNNVVANKISIILAKKASSKIVAKMVNNYNRYRFFINSTRNDVEYTEEFALLKEYKRLLVFFG